FITLMRDSVFVLGLVGWFFFIRDWWGSVGRLGCNPNRPLGRFREPVGERLDRPERVRRRRSVPSRRGGSAPLDARHAAVVAPLMEAHGKAVAAIGGAAAGFTTTARNFRQADAAPHPLSPSSVPQAPPQAIPAPPACTAPPPFDAPDGHLLVLGDRSEPTPTASADRQPGPPELFPDPAMNRPRPV
ncbi:hypothetical protein ACFUJU_29780, partial [Streptomyces sp. NPDC057235]